MSSSTAFGSLDSSSFQAIRSFVCPAGRQVPIVKLHHEYGRLANETHEVRPHDRLTPKFKASSAHALRRSHNLAARQFDGVAAREQAIFWVDDPLTLTLSGGRGNFRTASPREGTGLLGNSLRGDEG